MSSHTILVLDIGVIHLGLLIAEVSEDFSRHDILFVDLINITHFKHSTISSEECTLYHTRNFADWVDHFLQENRAFFDAADLILIEKQPPQGFVVVEQLIFGKFRAKTQLINPRQVHAYLNFTHLDYEKRKEFACKIADHELPPHLLEQTHFYDRRHDIGDCVCMLLFYMRKKAREWKVKKRREAFEAMKDMTGMSVSEKLELFRFI